MQTKTFPHPQFSHPIWSSIMQRDQSSFILSVHISSVLQEILGHLQVIITSWSKQINSIIKTQIDEMNVCSMWVNTWRHVTCKVQWCGVPALCVSAVDVFRAAEFLHSSQTALLGGIQQGGVSTQQVLDVRVSVLHHVQSHVAITVLLRWVSAVLKKEYIYMLVQRGCVTLIIIIINPKTAKKKNAKHHFKNWC